MTEPLLTISAFAQAVDLAPSTLRYYDEAGLLPPAEVDGRTGYRYYTPELERRAHLIRRMREVGVPVETMRAVLDGTPVEAAELLRGFASRADQTARRTGVVVEEVLAGLASEATPDDIAISLDGPELAAALRRVRAAADDDADSPLGVVLLDIADGAVTVVATNRYWLAYWTIPLVDAPVGRRRLAVPAAEVAVLADWLVRQTTVTLDCGPRIRMIADQGEREVATVADRFPAYRMLIDIEPCGRAGVETSALLSAIQTTESTAVVRVGTERLSVATHGQAEGVRLAAITAGEPIEFGIDPALLSAALQTLVGTYATLSYAAPDHPIQLGTAEQRNLTALVMPRRLDA